MNTDQIELNIDRLIKENHLLQEDEILSWNRLEGGLINFTYRIQLTSKSLILKYYPPYIASIPDIPLSSSRCQHEKLALQQIPLLIEQPKTPLYIGGTQNLNLLEDKGSLPSLQEIHSPVLIQKIAHWLARLHESTQELSKEDQANWNNRHIQQSRKTNQYDHLATMITSSIAKSHLRVLGQSLLQPGICCIMGDLWPPSILIDNMDFVVIDWEFSHYGRPLQDVAHICAHFMLMKQQQYCSLFLQTYLSRVSQALYDDVLSYSATHHFCAEILIRTMGLFENQEQRELQKWALCILEDHKTFKNLFSDMT
jgi:hypothetical protein